MTPIRLRQKSLKIAKISPHYLDTICITGQPLPQPLQGLRIPVDACNPSRRRHHLEKSLHVPTVAGRHIIHQPGLRRPEQFQYLMDQNRLVIPFHFAPPPLSPAQGMKPHSH